MNAIETISGPIKNKTWKELRVGDSASITRTCSLQDLFLFAHVSGNANPLSLPDLEGQHSDKARGEAVAPSMWVGSLISAVIGNILPGPGSLYKSQTLDFKKQVHIGDTLTITVTCKEKLAEPEAVFQTSILDADGRIVCEGSAIVNAPILSQTVPARSLPALIVNCENHFGRILSLAEQLPSLKTVVVCPEDRNSLGGAILSYERGLIEPILIGDEKRIAKVAAEMGVTIAHWPLVHEPDHALAAARAVAMIHEGKASAVMKGAIHSDELLAAVVKKDGGLRTSRRISHIFALDVPTLEEMLFITDAAINIAPDLMTKVDIVQNSIDLARACGLSEPKVGVLSAVETINPNIPSTLDAAVLSKMAERGQIKGGVVDGPLAMDNAIDVEAARTKGIHSLVAGHANVLVVPNLEAGNMLAKELIFVARAESAGLVVGARVPIILTSRADNDRARLVSCALALLYDYWRREGCGFAGGECKALAAE